MTSSWMTQGPPIHGNGPAEADREARQEGVSLRAPGGSPALSSDFWLQSCKDSHVCCMKPPSRWSFTVAATGNEHKVEMGGQRAWPRPQGSWVSIPRAVRAGPSPPTRPQRGDQLRGEGLCLSAEVHSPRGHRQPCRPPCLTEIPGKDLHQRAFVEKSPKGGAPRCRWEGERDACEETGETRLGRDAVLGGCCRGNRREQPLSGRPGWTAPERWLRDAELPVQLPALASSGKPRAEEPELVPGSRYSPLSFPSKTSTSGPGKTGVAAPALAASACALSPEPTELTAAPGSLSLPGPQPLRPLEEAGSARKPATVSTSAAGTSQRSPGPAPASAFLGFLLPPQGPW